MAISSIQTVKIHPAIGIARVGNSPDRFFIGPEKPGDRAAPEGGYKDRFGRMKRQAARFRLFGYDAAGNLVQEITQEDANITWTVHVANKKAAWKKFDGLKQNTPLRNASIKDRKSLIIDPGSRSITGPRTSAMFDSGLFLRTPVPLGEIRTDEDGHLLVLGGFGASASPDNRPVDTFANNDGWHDDVSDGPVSASVRLNGQSVDIQAKAAWVICGPPDFAPALDSITTLYDVLQQFAVDHLGVKPPVRPSFTKHIYPILRRVIQMQWVSMMAGGAHKTLLTVIPPPGPDAVRAAIFARLKNPNDGTGDDMPMIFSDTEEKNEAITRLQYDILRKWKDEEFENDWNGPPEAETQITPDGLDRAALESCIGGAFFPGIEAGWFMRDVYKYSEPFRLDQTKLSAGDVTKQMSVPWQADFYACHVDGDTSWWPSQRPDDVFPDDGSGQISWTRDLVNSADDMVQYWYQLGVVVQRGEAFLETERYS